MTFDLVATRFEFAAEGELGIARENLGNTLRGALGLALRAVCGADEYGRLFQPAGVQGPSGFADPPRPFVIRPVDVSVAGCALDLLLFQADTPPLDAFTRAFWWMSERGFGPRRVKAAVTVGTPHRISVGLEPVRLVQWLQVHFESPTELKHQGQPVVLPEFGVVAARVRDRIQLLRSLYGAGPLDIDFREFGERAATVTLTASDLRDVQVDRRSSRTGQRHGIGGIIGWAEYAGDLTRYLPYLEAARYAGIGRHTVWGNGAIRPEVIE